MAAAQRAGKAKWNMEVMPVAALPVLVKSMIGSIRARIER